MRKIPVDYTIDDGVKIPVRKHLPVHDLEVGQSFEFPIGERPSITTVTSRLKKRDGRVFTVQKINETTCRVWRVE